MNKPMKYILLFTIAFCVQTSIFSQSKVLLGEEEIRKSPYTKFENRSDKFATPERKAIEVEIGKGLHALVIESDKPINYKGFTLQRFYSDEPGKFGGDILVLNKNSSYGHINSIKRILNAYIQTSFEYTEKNADKIVMEVLYYNAQNRQKLERIKKRYTKSLISALDKNKVGIGKKFSDWPGNTQIIIPIKSPALTKSSEDISNKTPDEKQTTPSDEKNPITEKEKIKITKEKVPSSEMPKENITNTGKPSEDKKTSKSDEPVIKEEKKNIEIRIQKEKDETFFTESEIKQPEKNKSTSNPSESKSSSNLEDGKDTEKNLQNEDNVDKPKEDKTSNTKDSSKEVKEEQSKNVSDVTTPTKENLPSKDQPKTIVEKDKTPVKETAKQTEKEEKPAPTKETKNDTTKSVVVNETKSVPSKTVTSDKPAVKDTKTTEEPPKKIEEPKKETPKKDTVSTSNSAKQTVDKIPTTKTEIKKMHKELVELKAKEKDKVENSDNVVGEKIVFLKVKEFLAEGHYSSEMWAVDTENDDELFQSPFKKVCGKEFKELDTGVVVMSFKDNDMLKTDTHHLALLDKDNLKLIKQTNEIIFWRSFVKEQNGKIYAVEYKDGKYYLAQFKNDLTFEMRSSDPINPDCEIAFKKNKIYLTKRSTEDSEVSIRVLNRDNLKLRDLKVVK